MMSLANGPELRAKYYPIYNVHGFRFHTLSRDEEKKTQNSGIMVKRENQLDGNVAWYGTIIDIVELWYTKGNRIVLFNCNWFDTATKGSSYKVDRYRILSVNTIKSQVENSRTICSTRLSNSSLLYSRNQK